ncbi:MAG: replication protein DnaC [Candidatus Sumerlaeota bacterium]|jgi:DNA replication protein DnaC|nr:replication protein DnaC [Candidatus Sumerlaeota bacterium]
MTPAKTKASEPEICPHCGGYGLIVGDDGNVTKCQCGLWDEEKHRLAMERARIPARFRNKRLSTFRVAPGDTVRRDIRKFAESYARSFTPKEERGLILRGGTGSGKTHIATGILHEVLRNGYSGLYVNVSSLMARLQYSFEKDSEERQEEILGEMDSADLLVFDDLGAESARDWIRDRIYLIINNRYESCRALIVTTNCDDSELAVRNGERVVSRLHEMCQNFRFPDGDFRFENMR